MYQTHMVEKDFDGDCTNNNITSKLVVISNNFALRTAKACESISRRSLSRTFEAPHLACLTEASEKCKQ
jgi:hypothetical protein